MKDYDEIIRQKGLPQVGQTVRSKKYGTLWRVIKKWEVWQNIEPDPQTGEPRMIPAIYLSFWRIQAGVLPGVGRMMGYIYTLYDNTFEANWEIVSEEYPEPAKSWQEEKLRGAEVCQLPPARPRGSKNVPPTEEKPTKGKVIGLRLTKKAVYRAAEKELKKLYQLSGGGSDPIIDELSREMFERGEIDEVRWKDWASYCAIVINKMGNGFE